MYESGFDEDGGDNVEAEGIDAVPVEVGASPDEDAEEDLARGYPGNLIVKSNNDNTGLEETWTRRAMPCTFWVSSS